MMKPGKFHGSWTAFEADGVVKEAGIFPNKKAAQTYCDEMNQLLSSSLNFLEGKVKKSSAKSSNRSSNASNSRSKKVIGKVKSSSRSKVVHTQSIKNGKKVCSCEGFRYQGHCKHLPGVENSNISIQKVAAPKGKTTRAAMIRLLIKNIGKVVSLKSILEAAKKLKGVEVSEKKVAKRVPEVAHFAKTRGLKLVKASNGFKFQTV